MQQQTFFRKLLSSFYFQITLRCDTHPVPWTASHEGGKQGATISQSGKWFKSFHNRILGHGPLAQSQQAPIYATYCQYRKWMNFVVLFEVLNEI